jgi:hypothetical protein
MRFSSIKSWVASLCLLALVACGGGGGGGDPVLGGGGGGVVTTAKSLQIKFSAKSVDNSGAQTVIATVTAVDVNGQGVSGVPVTLKVDKNATYTISSGTGTNTGEDGTVTALVSIGNDLSLRTITMTASAAGLADQSASFDVVGNRQLAADLTLTVTPTLVIKNSFSNTLTVLATAVDANRNALPGIPVTIKVDNGATLVPSGTVTGLDGTVSGVLRIGADQSNRQILVTATSGEVSRQLPVQVSGTTLTASGVTSTVGINSSNRITYVLTDNTGAKMAGYNYSVTGSGLLPPQSGQTNADGEFTYNFVAPATAQQVVITATAGGAPNTQTIRVMGLAVIDPVPPGSVTSASVSASPSVISVNDVGSTSNKAEVRALFVGANNAPIPNVRVWFDLDGDPQSIGGTLDSVVTGTLLYSDANGVARTTYAPGARLSPKDGVTIRACWSNTDFVPVTGGVTNCPNAVRATMTVSSDSLSVSIGTNAELLKGASTLTYVKRYAVQVVDSAGQAKAGVQISPSIDLLTYYKGEWFVGTDSSGVPRWIAGGRGNRYPTIYPSSLSVPGLARRSGADTATATWIAGNLTACDNEDLNRNGVGESFPDLAEQAVIPEDQNGSGTLNPTRPLLDPRKADVAISIEGSALTNANGIVVLRIEYPQNIAGWVRFNILVSASGVAGTEGRANFEGILPVEAAAVTALTIDPPFRYSPYGTLGSDAYLRINGQGQQGWLCTNPF